jgi:hypothetical protein
MKVSTLVALGAVLRVIACGSLVWGAEDAGVPDAAALLEEARTSPERVLVDEGFETDNGARLVEWYAGQLAHTTDFSGVTDEQAFAGRRSYKVQMTFPAGRRGATYLQLPTDIPVWSDVNVTLRVKLVCQPAPWCAHGLGWGDAEAGISGNIYRGLRTAEDNGWELWDTTIKADSGIARHVLGASLMIYLPDTTAATVMTVYVDQIRVTAKLPSNWAEKWAAVYRYFTVDGERIRRADAQRRLTDMKAWQESVAQTLREVEAWQAAPGTPASVVEQAAAALRRAREDLAAAAPLLQALGQALADEKARFTFNPNPAERLLTTARHAAAIARAYVDYANPAAPADFVPFFIDLTQSYAILPQGSMAQNVELSYYDWDEKGAGLENPQVLPRDPFVQARPGRLLQGFGCRDTLVPLSFAVRAVKTLDGLTFTATDLTSGREAIAASALDLRVVAPWYRPFGGKPRLLNEILVHDPEFVTPVEADQKNLYKSEKFPDDAAALLPVTIPAGTNRQFYATLRIPVRAVPGVYTGKLTGRTRDGMALSWEVSVEVLPFDLEPTPYAYGAFYRTYERSPEQKQTEGVESPGTFPVYRTLAQMQAEFISMVEHGFNTAQFYEGTPTRTAAGWDFSKLERLLAMARQAGLTRSPFTWLGHGMAFAPRPGPDGPQTAAEVVQQIGEFITAANAFCKEKGYPQPAFYGEDEASGDKLIGLRPGYAAATRAGGIVAVACYPSYFGEVGDALSLPIVYGGAQTPAGERALRASQKAGYECWIYNVPASNMAASPAVYRRRYGLAMWKNGEQGAMPWEFSGMLSYAFAYEKPLYAFAYPTVSGKPVDTIIYEAYREGIYDTRYLATLQSWLGKAKARQLAPALTARIDAWLASLSVHDDLQQLRRQMADFTAELQRQG